MDLRDRLYRIYWKLEQVIVPGLANSQRAYEEAIEEVTRPGVPRWLDLGCGHRLLPDWREAFERELLGRSEQVWGLDSHFDSLLVHRSIHRLVNGDIGALPFPDASFDLVTCNMVFEHLDAPERQLAEIQRVLKPEGRLVFHTPNARGYAVALSQALPNAFRKVLVRLLEGRPSVDVFPTFYRCNTPEQILSLSRAVGLNVESIRLVSSNAHFVVVPPLAVVELLYIRATQRESLKHLRSNLVVVLSRPG